LFLDPVTWAERYFWFDRSSTTQGRFSRSSCGFLCAPRGPLLEFSNPRIRSGTCMCAAQCGKTQAGLVCSTWALSEDPGPYMWTLPAADEAKTFSQTRLMDSVLRCDPLRRLLPDGRYDVKDLQINFATAPLLLVGAGSRSKLSGKPIKWLFIDEEKDYKPGAVEAALNRVTAKWDCKIWRMSTPDHEEDSIDRAFQDGDQRRWYVTCPKCGHKDHLQRKHLLWDHEDLNVTNIRYKCPGQDCDHAWLDTPADRLRLANEGEWIAHNPLAEDASWTWNAILPPWAGWKDSIIKYLKAKKAWRSGDREPLKVCHNEVWCEPWSEEFLAESTNVEVTPTYSVKDFAAGDKIDGEAIRFATVDRQLDHRWVIIRAWRQDQTSRLLAFEMATGMEAQKMIIARYGVQPNHVFCDYGYEQDKVFAECSENGWIAIRGLANVESFKHPIKNSRNQVVGQEDRLYSRIIYKDAGRGCAPCKSISIAPQRIKDITSHLRAGHGADWQVPHDIPEIYLNQLKREVKKKGRDPRTGAIEMRWPDDAENNHAFDCECYQSAAAIIYGILKVS
jgi:phage terminase large subunit GpA-like protein